MALRVCALEGTRKEGERCLRYPQPALRQWACEEGLVCAGSGVSTDDAGNGVCLFSPEQWVLDAAPAQHGG